mmetsp:Transcript_65382/g.77394  ORF Transcript_65382/g.77394 Transcript_65382/m.77394 type:complete len:353 (+) Transcript_65382:100-1158(+)
MDPSNVIGDFGDAEELTRSQLQQALKAWCLPARGTNVVLRERYKLYCQNHAGAATTSAVAKAKATATATAAAASTAEVLPPSDQSKKPHASKPPSAEKRLRRYRSSPTQNIIDRIYRARAQKMYLIRKEAVKDLSCDFVVLGSTGNVYTVTISFVPHCTCPDHAKGNLCKHILFVLLKVMGLDSSSPLIYQAAWISVELSGMFKSMNDRRRHVSGAVLANAAVRDTFEKLQKGEETDLSPSVARKAVDENDDCPICFDPLGGNEGGITFCRGRCGANFHQVCIRHWLQQNRQRPTCPMCREPWEDSKRKNCGDATPEGFTNLGQLQGQSQERDTSTYSTWYMSSGYKRRRWR